jgi:HPt (histidine-containing phosphotransfer) domain-containing protein
MATVLPFPTHPPAPSRALRGLEERLASSGAERADGTLLAGPESDWDGAAPIDYRQLRQRLRGGDDVIRRILGLFPDECTAGLAQLQQRIAGREWTEAAEVAHRLKGAAGTIAAADLRAAASGVESACRRREIEAVQRALLDLFHEALRAVEYVNTILERP